MNLKELEVKEMVSINGGGITYSFINAIVKAVSTIFDLGEKTGSAIRRFISGEYCNVR